MSTENWAAFSVWAETVVKWGMASSSVSRFRAAGLLAGAAFAVLLGIRLDLWEAVASRPRGLRGDAAAVYPARESWMSIFQNNRKVGFAHRRLQPGDAGYDLDETVVMRINTMGMVQELRLKSRFGLDRSLALQHFEFDIQSGRFRFSARGRLAGGTLSVDTQSAGSQGRIDIPAAKEIRPVAALAEVLARADLTPGKRYELDAFDPASLARVPVQVEVIGPEDLQVFAETVSATRVTLNFRGMVQTAWIDASGDLLRERGLLGMRLEKTTRAQALAPLGLEELPDLTEAAAVTPDRPIADPQGATLLRLRLQGPVAETLRLQGGRQRYVDGVLTIRLESLEELPASIDPRQLGAFERVFLRAEPLIQSDHEKIRAVVRAALGENPELAPLEKARRLMGWMQLHIEKRPVLSMPDALSTLENRMGDCNEHAMLFAALARAAGIPARVEAGLVYMRGRFYYHAWNLLFLGEWVTADPLFNQLPADVTHIRLVTGSMQQQFDLLGVMGQLQIEVVEDD
ncbi:MAG: transglutaminase-like domain-containing protein [Desulfobacterales bacterium]|jgi:transglutaminase-like putative cysteine protease|nr:transglutaminase-like domain-containing protein [Desulfobacterales bacterium]